MNPRNSRSDMIIKAQRLTLFAFLFLVTPPALVPAPETVPVLPVHFTVIAGSRQVTEAATREILEREIDLLNQYVHDRDGHPLARFRLHSISFYEDIKTSACPMVKLANSTVDTLYWIEHEGSPYRCMDPRVVDPRAINVFILDWYSKEKGFADNTSYGGRAFNGAVFVALDYIYLQMPQNEHIRRHEFGHALGLGHECLPNDKEACPGGATGGNRSVMGTEAAPPYLYSTLQSQIVRGGTALVNKHVQDFVPRPNIENGGFELITQGLAFWQTASMSQNWGNPGHTGALAAIVGSGDTMFQWLELSEPGTYRMRLYASTDVTGATVGIAINGVKNIALPIVPGPKRAAPMSWFPKTEYQEYNIRDLRLAKGDLIEVYVKAGSKDLVVDDFELINVDRPETPADQPVIKIRQRNITNEREGIHLPSAGGS
ncbi:MAG: hypothetical protein HY042_02445 [Spirochaetia bacterium]|nr:hypothetical protein [Spirochaetia bacterium]